MNNPKPQLNRRAFLQISAVAMVLPEPLLAASEWKKIPIATQAWCVRKQMATDIPGTLAAVAQVGYQGIELENAFGKSGPEWRQYLDAVKLKPAGLRVGYHNHSADFNQLGQDYWWNLFADQTHKDVILQFDTGNASEMQGVTVTDFLKRNPGRTVSMHVKPFSKAKPDAFLGDDELDWKQILTVVESVGGLEWYIIEYERDAFPPLEALKANLERFKKIRHST